MTGVFLTVLGIPIHYVESGSGPVVLYIHGNSGSSFWFSKVMEIPGFRTVAPDMPNFGRSGRISPDAAPDASDLHLYADHMAGFIHALGIAGEGRAPIVVGHSLGGAVAMSLATRHPGLVGALMLVDSSPPSGLRTPEDRYPLIELMRTNPAVLRAALASVMPTIADPSFLDTAVEEARLMNPASFAGNARALTGFDCTALCGNFSGPVLVVRGAKDSIITGSMAQATADAFPAARLVTLPHVGHAPMAEDPSGFAGLVAEFASSALGNGGGAGRP